MFYFAEKWSKGVGGGGTRRPLAPPLLGPWGTCGESYPKKLRLENATNYVIVENVRFF